MGATALDDEDILVADGSEDVDLCLAVAEFVEVTLCGGGAQALADGVDEESVGGAGEYIDTSHGRQGRAWRRVDELWAG